MIGLGCFNGRRIAKYAAPGLCSVLFLAGAPLYAASSWGHDAMIAAGDPGVTIKGWSPITCTIKHPNPPDRLYPKTVDIHCAGTISGRIDNGSPSMHYRIRAYFLDLNEEKGHLSPGLQISNPDGEELPVVVGNGDFSVHLVSDFSDENGECPAGTYKVNEIHLEVVYDVAPGGSSAYVDNKKGRVDIVCHG